MGLIFEEETYAILGACFEVYKELGCGFLEAVYQECLELELNAQGVPFEAQSRVMLVYKAHQLKQHYEPDLLCYGKVVMEIKTVKTLADEHRAQIHNYLKATGLRVGLLVNVGHYPKVEHERIVR